MDENSLLLGGSCVFDNNRPIDCIRQSFIDLNKQSNIDSVQDLLEKSFNDITNENIQYDIASEFIFLINKIFSYFSDKMLPIFKNFFANSRSNAYTIISSASIISFLINSKPELTLPDYNSFVNDALNEIQPQIQNIDKLSVFKHEIPFQFKVDLIFDLLLSIKPNKERVTQFSPFLISKDISENEKFSLLIKKISKEGLIQFLPPSVLIDHDLFKELTVSEIDSILPNLSDQIFKQKYSQIEEVFSDAKELNSQIIINFLKRCLQLKLKPVKIEYIFDFLSSSDFTPEICEFLKNLEISISAKQVEKFIDFPDFDLFMQILPDTELIRSEVLKRILAVKSGESNPNFSSVAFYTHLYSLYDKAECPEKLTKIITVVFKKFIPKEKLNEAIDEMIFSVFPTNKYLASFLYNFLSKLDLDSSSIFYSKEHMKSLIDKILEKKAIPNYNFAKILDKEVIYQMLKKTGDVEDPLLLYLYVFSTYKSKNEPKQLKELTIMPQKNPTCTNAINFIKDLNYELMTELDEEFLSLAASALVFAENKEKMNVKGLTKDNVLQFYGIASLRVLDNNYFDKKLDLISTPEMMSLLMDEIKNSAGKKSSVFTDSIDSILISFEVLPIFSNDCRLQILKILAEFLANGQYHGNNANLILRLIHDRITDVPIHSPSLISVFDEAAKGKKWEEVSMIGNFMAKNGLLNEIREDINKNDQIPSDAKIKIIPMNESTIDDVISNFLSSQNPESDENLQKVLFEKMMTDKTNVEGYFHTIFENIKGPTTEPKQLLEYFNEEYNQYKDEFIKVLDRVLTFHPTEKVFIIKADRKPFDMPDSEFNTKIINRLYDVVSKDPLNFQAYICLELISNSFPFIFASNPRKAFEAVLPALDYLPYIFAPRAEDEKEKEMDIKKAKAAVAAISFLLSASNSTKVLDAYFPWFFEHYQSFTLSQIFGALVLFFSASMVSILASIVAEFYKHDFFKACSEIFLKDIPENLYGENFNYVLYALLLSMNKLPDLLGKGTSLSIKVYIDKDDIFYLNSGRSITHLVEAIQAFNIETLYLSTEDIKTLNFSTLSFISKNRNIKPKWTTENREKDENISQEQVDEFMANYMKSVTLGEPAEDFNEIDVDGDTKINIVRYLIGQERWIFRYTVLDERFPLLSNHYEMLEEVVENLPECKDDSDDDSDDSDDDSDDDDTYDSDNMSLNDFNLTKYFKSFRVSVEFLKNAITRMVKTYIYPICRYVELFAKIGEYAGFASVFFSTILENFKEIDRKYYYFTKKFFLIFRANISALDRFCTAQLKQSSIDDDDFRALYFKLCGKYLIDIVLHPYYRSNQLILRINYQFIITFKEYPIQVLHIIAFMFLTNDKYLVIAAAQLCNRFKEEDFDYFEIIDDVFSKELNKDKPQIEAIAYLLKAKSHFVHSHRVQLNSLLASQLKKYKKQLKDGNKEEEETNDDDDYVKIKIDDFIIQLIDNLAPDRNINKSFVLSDSILSKKHKVNPMFRFYPIPDHIYNTSPAFWNIFEKYRQIINDMILKKIKENPMLEPSSFIEFILLLSISQFSSRFVSSYPECFTFDFRSTFFRQEMHDKLHFLDSIKIEVNRNHILRDSYKILKNITPYEWKNRIVVEYEDNQGIDAGGLTKDWFLKISQAIFNPDNDLFEVSETSENYSPSRSLKAKSPENLEKFKFIGMLIARALIQGEFVDAHFTRAFLKLILHHDSRIKFDDLEDTDKNIFESMKFWLEFDFDKNPDVDQRFEINGINGEVIELVPNGSNIKLNNQNKFEYVELVVNHRLYDSIKEQTEAFREGFDSLISHNEIRLFTPNELSLLICGIPKIDVNDFRENVEFKDGYDENTPVVKIFFEAISKWDDESLAKLLIFITGTSRMSSIGFRYFKQKGKAITIAPGGSKERLPVAHTCTNTLDLPSYESEEELNSKMLIAIQEDSFQLR